MRRATRLERGNSKSGPVVVDRSDDNGHPFWFPQSEWFRQSDRAWFRDRHDKRFPIRFFPRGSKVVGFGVTAAFSWGNRHHKPVPFRISPNRSPALAHAQAGKSVIAKINGFRREFPQAGRGFWRQRRFFMGNRHDKRLPIRFFPRRSKVAVFGVTALFLEEIAIINRFPLDFPQVGRGLWRDRGPRMRGRHCWRFLQNFSQRRRRITVFGTSAVRKSGVAMINRFRFEFSQADRRAGSGER